MEADFLDGLKQMLKPPTKEELDYVNGRTDVKPSAGPALAGAEIERMTHGIAEVLAKHHSSEPHGDVIGCVCGQDIEVKWAEHYHDAHDRHVARKIAEWLAEGE